MDSKRSFVEAYVSARYPATHPCGMYLPTSYMTELYPYVMEVEIDYLLDLFTIPGNRALFELYVLPEIALITDPDRQSDALTRGEAFSISIVRAAMLREDAATLAWLTDFDGRPAVADMLHDALGTMHELMVTVYHQPDIAFSVWFPTATEYEQQQRRGLGQQPVHSFVEQYLLFLAEAARIKSGATQNKIHTRAVMPHMTTTGQVHA